MRARLAALVATIAAIIGLAMAHPGPAYADCPSGTNWDNHLQRCV